MNRIMITQNADPQIKLLRARHTILLRAERRLIWQICLALILPVIGEILSIVYINIGPYVAFSALSVAILDVGYLDRSQRVLLEISAKIAEQFDCEVLSLPWNRFVVGKLLDPETIYEAASVYSKKRTDDALLNWYPQVVASVPIHLARIICQRTNLWYDRKLRYSYRNIIVVVASLMVVSFFSFAIYSGITMISFVVDVVAPATPFLIWSTREYYRQLDRAEVGDKLLEDSEELWERARGGDCSPEYCLEQSRNFQNALFTRRATNPLVLPLVEWLLSRSLEEQMNAGAAHHVEESKKHV